MTHLAKYLSITLLLVCGCSRGHSITQGDGQAAGDLATQKSEDRSGQVVMIRGTIKGMHGQRAFAVATREKGELLSNQQVLVVASVPMQVSQIENVSQQELSNEDAVIVRGKLRKFDRAALHQELGWNPLHLEGAYDGQPVVVADSVTMADDPLSFWNNPIPGYEAEPGAI